METQRKCHPSRIAESKYLNEWKKILLNYYNIPWNPLQIFLCNEQGSLNQAIKAEILQKKGFTYLPS